MELSPNEKITSYHSVEEVLNGLVIKRSIDIKDEVSYADQKLIFLIPE